MKEKKEVTIYDIARELQLSPATVSRSLNDSPVVRKKTKTRVLEAAEKMGYHTNYAALSLRKKSTQTLGIIVPRLNNSDFVPAVLAGIENVTNKYDYNLIITQSQESERKEKINANTLFNRRVDGLIVALAFNTTDLEHFNSFFENEIPVIFYDRVEDDTPGTNIVIDNYRAGYAATKHLIDQGYTRIGHITGNLSRNVYADRLRGYQQALRDNGLKWEEECLIVNDLTAESAREAAVQIMHMESRPDSIFITNDRCAAVFMQTLKDAGMEIPRDLGVVGFNNDPIGTIIQPKLTTINYPSYEMGELIAENMINLLEGKMTSNKGKTIVIHSELIVRESSLKSNYK